MSSGYTRLPRKLSTKPVRKNLRELTPCSSSSGKVCFREIPKRRLRSPWMRLSAISSRSVTSSILKRERILQVLLPDKHIRIADALLGFSGLIVSELSGAATFDHLWGKVHKLLDTPDWPAVQGADNF